MSFLDDENEYQLSLENTAGGIGGEPVNIHDPENDSLGAFNDHSSIAQDAASEAYGANPHSRWAGTPAIGLSMFQSRTENNFRYLPGPRGPRVRRVIDASTRMASPPTGLIGGKALEYRTQGFKDRGMASALTPESEWRGQFQQRNPVKPGPTVTNRNHSVPSIFGPRSISYP